MKSKETKYEEAVERNLYHAIVVRTWWGIKKNDNDAIKKIRHKVGIRANDGQFDHLFWRR